MSQSFLTRQLRGLLDFIFPRYCAVCGNVLSASEHQLCIGCFIDIPRTGYHNATHSVLETLYWGKLPIEKSTAFMFYKEGYKEILLNIKYRNRYSTAEYFGQLMAREINEESDFFNGIDAIIPVPLHWKRFLKRGYNQSLYIAKGVKAVTGIPIYNDVVKRRASNPSQTRMTYAERSLNVANIFQCTNPEKVRGKHILILDDVITSGATSLSCAEAILKGLGDYDEKGVNISGSVKISILALATATKYHEVVLDTPPQA